MTTMVVEVYDALRAANVPDDKAKAAAQALTQDMGREIGGLRGEVAALRKDTEAGIAALRKDTEAGIAALRKDTEAEFRSVRADIAGLKSDVAVLRWMLGSAFAVLIAVAVKIFLA